MNFAYPIVLTNCSTGATVSQSFSFSVDEDQNITVQDSGSYTGSWQSVVMNFLAANGMDSSSYLVIPPIMETNLVNYPDTSPGWIINMGDCS